jgi:hypothetical protein
MMDLNRRNWRQSEPVKLGQPEQPELLARAVLLLDRERSYGMTDLAKEVALSPARLTGLVFALRSAPRADLTLS